MSTNNFEDRRSQTGKELIPDEKQVTLSYI